MNKNTMSFRVRYAETDQMGVAHHGSYFTWFEMGRSAFCRELDKPYATWEAEGLFLPVVDVSCRYKKSARYDDMLFLTTYIEEIRQCSVTFAYRLERRSDQAIIAKGKTKHAFVSASGKILRKHPLIDWFTGVVNSSSNTNTEEELS